QIAVCVTRSVGCGAARASYGDMWQRGKIVQCKSLAVEIRAQLSIRGSGFDGHGACLEIKRNHFVHCFKREKVMATVGDLVEAMSGTENLEGGLFSDKITNPFRRIGR